MVVCSGCGFDFMGGGVGTNVKFLIDGDVWCGEGLMIGGNGKPVDRLGLKVLWWWGEVCVIV